MLALGAVLYANYQQMAAVDDDVVDMSCYEMASRVALTMRWFCAAIFFCAVCCMRRQIMLAMGVVKEAAKVVNSMMLIVMLPIVRVGITIFMIVWFIYIVFGIATAGEKVLVDKDSLPRWRCPTRPSVTRRTRRASSGSCSSTCLDHGVRRGSRPDHRRHRGRYVLLHAGPVDHRQLDRRLRRRGTRRGTTPARRPSAVFCIAVIKIIKAILMYIQRKCENAIDATGDGPVQRRRRSPGSSSSASSAASGASKCMKFINKEAYIQTAIFGHPFCTAARKGFFLVCGI